MNFDTDTTRRAALGAGLGIAVWLGTGCSGRATPGTAAGPGSHAFGGATMGTRYTVKIAKPGLGEAALAAAKSAVASALDEVVALMSHHEPGSELARLNRQPIGRAMAVSAPTLQVFSAAQAVREASAGAFDVALGAAVEAWGFGVTRPASRLPAAAQLRALRRPAAETALAIDPRAGTLTRLAPVLANLSGIAKGHGVDLAAMALERLGIADYLVEVGGEIRTLGRNGLGQPWRLAIERPDAMPQRALEVVPLSGRSLATSGDYRNFFMHDGRRYTHEIDPASAEPVRHALASVSVVADDCMSADAWSTALFVQGPERGLATANRLGLAACFVQRVGGGGLAITRTAAFQALGGSTVG